MQHVATPTVYHVLEIQPHARFVKLVTESLSGTVASAIMKTVANAMEM